MSISVSAKTVTPEIGQYYGKGDANLELCVCFADDGDSSEYARQIVSFRADGAYTATPDELTLLDNTATYSAVMTAKAALEAALNAWIAAKITALP